MRNPSRPFEYNFNDPVTGELNDQLSDGQKLQELKDIIRRLRSHKAMVDRVEDAQVDDPDAPPEEEEKVKNNQDPAGDEFLIWEPQTCGERIKNFIWNMMEANVIFLVAFACYCHPSYVSILYFWAYMVMLYPMTKNIKDRFRWCLLILFGLLVFQLFLVSYKLKASLIFKDIPLYNNKEEYFHGVVELIDRGFVFAFNEDIL